MATATDCDKQPAAGASADPTSEYHDRKDRLLADPRVIAWLAELKNQNVSLVLAGGGGKGAYEAGVILALYDLGITEFHSLAGTSVGALNAALCHAIPRSPSPAFASTRRRPAGST